MNNNLEIKKTNIDGLLEINIPVFYDDRGFFKENWQREKMVAAGLPDFQPVQHNVSFNAQKGVTRGMHAEPWDKLVSVATGKVFACIVDLREGENYGATVTTELNEGKSLFIPAGCANSFQALEDKTAYSYLVNSHWRADLEYKQYNLEDAKCTWPINLAEAIISEKDKSAKRFSEITPYKKKKIAVVGAGGQLGRAFQKLLINGEADFFDSQTLNISDLESFKKVNWSNYFAIINCAAYTKVDLAEVEVENSFKVNVLGVENVCKIAKENKLEVAHVSTDYVFDGAKNIEYKEGDVVNPKNVYGLHKALSEKVVENSLDKYYLIRTSWVMGEGKNFVNTMLDLANKGLDPKVVNDQIGRPTFASDLAQFILFLIKQKAYGLYHFSNSGEAISFAELAKEVYKIKDLQNVVTEITTEEFFKDKTNYAVRPKNSKFDLSKVESLGYKIPDWKDSLSAFLKEM